MSAGVAAGPSAWAVRRFGEAVATHLWWEVPAALGAAVDRAVNAREASRMTTDHAFGNARWPLQYEELAGRLSRIDGAVLIRPPRVCYELVVIRQHVLLPWCYGRAGTVPMAQARLGRSFGRLARELLRRFGPPPLWTQPSLPLFPPDEQDEREVAAVSDTLDRLDPPPRILIVGYACNSEQGLVRVAWGEAALADGEHPHWHYVEDLPLPAVARIPRPRGAAGDRDRPSLNQGNPDSSSGAPREA